MFLLQSVKVVYLQYSKFTVQLYYIMYAVFQTSLKVGVWYGDELVLSSSILCMQPSLYT